MRWNYFSICNLQVLGCWILGTDKQFHPTLYHGCDYLSMLGLKFISADKRGPHPQCVVKTRLIHLHHLRSRNVDIGPTHCVNFSVIPSSSNWGRQPKRAYTDIHRNMKDSNIWCQWRHMSGLITHCPRGDVAVISNKCTWNTTLDGAYRHHTMPTGLIQFKDAVPPV